MTGRGAEALPHATLASLVAEHPHHVDHVARELLDRVVGVAPECGCGHLVGAGSAPDSEIDSAWMQRLQQGELLGDCQRGVVGQHDPA